MTCKEPSLHLSAGLDISTQFHGVLVLLWMDPPKNKRNRILETAFRFFLYKLQYWKQCQVIKSPFHDICWSLTVQFFCSVVILAPSSFYLEEAFSVLHFQHWRQIRFYLGCLLSGILGILLQLCAAKLRSSQRFQQTQAVAKLCACLAAIPVFNTDLSVSVWGFAAANLISSVLIPSNCESIEKHDDVLNV